MEIVLIFNNYNRPEARLYIKETIDRFQSILSKYESVYNRKQAEQNVYSLTALYLLVKIIKPKTILEVGCGLRYSTIALSLAAAELNYDLKIFGVSIDMSNFNAFMVLNFPDMKYVPVTDFQMNAIDFSIDDKWEKPIFVFYDAHDDNKLGKISHHAINNWFPKLSNQYIALHDFGVSCNTTDSIAEGQVSKAHFSGQILYGYPEAPVFVDWMNKNTVRFSQVDEEFRKIGFPIKSKESDSGTGLIYFNIP